MGWQTIDIVRQKIENVVKQKRRSWIYHRVDLKLGVFVKHQMT